MFSRIVKKQMEIVDKNIYCWNFNYLLKRYDRLIKSNRNRWILVIYTMISLQHLEIILLSMSIKIFSRKKCCQWTDGVLSHKGCENLGCQFDWSFFLYMQRTLAAWKHYIILFCFSYRPLFKISNMHMNHFKQLWTNV